MRKLFLWGALLLGSSPLWSQPSWSVDLTRYEKRMSVTAVLFFDGVESRDDEDRVAAFINGEVRGVGSPNTYYAQDDRYLALLQIGDNEVSGSTITFRMYDASTNTEYPVEATLTFVAESSNGVVSAPYIITNNYLPEDIQLSSISLAENEPVGSAIGTLTSTDQDENDTFTYSLVYDELVGSDSASFRIDGNVLRSAVVYNFEEKDTYKVKIRTTDSKGGSYDEAFTIAVTDANDAPTAVIISNSQFSEHATEATPIGVLSSVDADATDEYRYNLVGSAADNALFLINGDTLVTAASFDFEARDSYTVQVKTTDAAGATFTQTLSLQVTDANDGPTDLLLDGAIIAENLDAFSTIGTCGTTDQDSGDTFTYTLVEGSGESPDEASFVLAGNELRSQRPLNFEAQNQYIITVRTTDADGASFEGDFTILVSDQNDTPTDMELSQKALGENLSVSTAIGQVATTDEDAEDKFTYSLITDEVLGPDSDLFIMDGKTLRAGASFDFETKNSYKIRLRTTDEGGAFYEESFTILIEDENDAPTALQLGENKVEELRAPETPIGRFTTTDEDAVDNFVYTISGGGADSQAFIIRDDMLLTAVELDRETQSKYQIEVTATDKGGETIAEVFTIEVIDKNEAPELEAAIFSIVENREKGFLVGTMKASDIDVNQELKYHILKSDPLSFIEEYPFALDSLTGDLTVNIPDSLDYESKDLYQFWVIVTDNGPLALTDTAEVIVRITDEPEGILPVNDLVSPNADGYNDYFTIRNVDVYSEYRLTIFNAEAQVVYSAQPYDNSWDGTKDGRPLTSGIYYYIFENAEGFVYRGMINLKIK